MIPLSCPSCQLKLKINDRSAGKKVRCPKCHKAFDIFPATTDLQRAGSEDATVCPRAASDATFEPNAEHSNGQAEEEPREWLKAEATYEVEGEIARGGMGAIIKAVDQEIRREVAVKFLLNHADSRQKARFVEEAQITGQLEHPNIVPIHQLGEHQDGRCFFSMKMVKGRSLAEILKGPVGEYSLVRLLGILTGICNALSYAHSRNVIHRDLKPANIMVGDFGEVYVMDWGLAKVLGTDYPPAPPPSAITTQGSASDSKHRDIISTSRLSEGELTQAGAIMGTPAYMPPEQAQGEDVDQRADIYSLGAILYEILTLTPPVGRGGDKIAVMMRVVEGKIDPPEKRSPDRAKTGWIPGELSAIAMKALAKEPADRYQTVETFRRDVELFLEGRSVSAKQDTAWEMFRKLVRRNKGASIATAIGVVVLLAVLAISFQFINAARLRAEDERGKAEAAYQAYKDQVRDSVPAFLRAAKLNLGERQFDDALVQASLASKSAPDNAKARLLKAELLVTRKRFAEAASEFEEHRKLKGGDDDHVRALTELCRNAQPDDVASLLGFADVFTQRQDHALADGVLQGEGKTALEARRRILEIYRKRIETAWPGKGANLKMSVDGRYSLLLSFGKVTDLTPLKGIALTSLNISWNGELRDLTPLKGMPLTDLNLDNCPQVRDLAPLKGMRLTHLNLDGCTQVADLEPLRGMPLVSLRLFQNQVRDLEPIRGMPLTELNLLYCRAIRDVTPLSGMKLTFLNLNGVPIRDLELLKGMPLRQLYLEACPIRSLEPLKDMPLKKLAIDSTVVSDLRPLEGMELEQIWLTPKNITQGLELLREMKSLKAIGIHAFNQPWPAPEFWDRYQKGEFKN